MHETPALLNSWSGFYVITGSSAAALTGLMFVVVTLVAGRPQQEPEAQNEGTATFSTPTVVHFCAAFFISAIMSAPWASLYNPQVVLAIAGVFGIVYVARLILRARRFQQYWPDVEDWSWFFILPLVAYVAIAVSAVLLSASSTAPLFIIAGATILLIFIGIHNAWDVVTFLAIQQRQE
jgi:hypothetical protein